MIPRTIHYCWFGKGKRPKLIRECIKSWQKLMPDYQFKCWSEENFDVSKIRFVREAYEEKKWAFVADYVRFYALYNEGGIYLDTDVEAFKRLDEFLDNDFFAGTEVRYNQGRTIITVDASAFGSIKGHWYTKLCMEFYHDKPFRGADGKISGDVVQTVATNILEKYGYIRRDQNQIINKDIRIYPTDYFANIENHKKGDNIYTLHHFDGSWTDQSQRGIIYKIARKYDLMEIYRRLEKILH